MGNPLETWSKMKSYLQEKEKGLIVNIKVSAQAGDMKSVSVKSVQLALIGDIIAHGESLDRGITSKGRATPPAHLY